MATLIVLAGGYEGILEVIAMSALDSQPLTVDERHAVWRMLAWTGGSYFLLFLAGLTLVFELRFLPPVAAAWMPNAVFAAVAALLLSPGMPMRERRLVV